VTVRVIRNGEEVGAYPMPSHLGGTVLDTLVQIPIEESSWIALRVTGTTTLKHAVGPEVFAHSGAVYVTLDGDSIRSRESCAYFLDWIDDIKNFVELRDNWSEPEHYFHILQQLEAGRAHYREAFVIPPEPFNLLRPVDGETLWVNYPELFEWEESLDSEPFDQVGYLVQVASDSLFQHTLPVAPTDETQQEIRLLISPGLPLWVRVFAIDRGDNSILSIQDTVKIHTIQAPADVGDQFSDASRPLYPPQLKLWPNPARSQVWLQLFPLQAAASRVEIFNVLGRRIAANRRPKSAVSPIRMSGPNQFRWDGRDDLGRLVPSGRYWIRITASTGSAGERQAVAPVLILR
jgi:hypothetical protein